MCTREMKPGIDIPGTAPCPQQELTIQGASLGSSHFKEDEIKKNLVGYYFYLILYFMWYGVKQILIPSKIIHCNCYTFYPF